MKIENITPNSEISFEELLNYIATCSSVVRDKQPKSAEKLFNRLLTESVGSKASRVLEYIPCTVKLDNLPNYKTKFAQYFGFHLEDNYYTNARELLNWGCSMDEVLGYIDFTYYKVFKCEAPYFIYGQVSTHNQLTTVSHSQRYANCDRGYWKPDKIKEFTDDAWRHIVENAKPSNLVKLMKDSGINRKEVFDRGRDMLQNRVFTIGGYTNNPNAWEHFFKQRLDTHTQKETREFVSMLFDS